MPPGLTGTTVGFRKAALQYYKKVVSGEAKIKAMKEERAATKEGEEQKQKQKRWRNLSVVRRRLRRSGSSLRSSRSCHTTKGEARGQNSGKKKAATSTNMQSKGLKSGSGEFKGKGKGKNKNKEEAKFWMGTWQKTGGKGDGKGPNVAASAIARENA